MNDPRSSWDPGSGEPVPPSYPMPPASGQAPPPGPAGFPPPGSAPPGAYPPPGSAPPGSMPPGSMPPGSMPPGAYPPPSGFQSPPGTVQPPAGFGPPQRKKRKIWGWIVGFFVVAMLGIGSCGFVLYRAVKGPIDQANAFLAAIDDGDYRNAAAMTSSEPTCFGETAQQDIAAFFAELDITDYDLTSVNVSNTGDDATGEVSGTISFAGRPTVPIDMGLVKQRDDWKICGVVVDP